MILILYSCGNQDIIKTEGILIDNKYSDRFEILKTTDGYSLNVLDKSNKDNNNIIYSYNLSYSDNNSIKIPVNKVICLSTTHCAFISQIGQTGSIKGISGAEYVYNNEIIDLIKKNEIIEVGYDKQIDYEKIISVNPDVVFVFGIDNSSIASYNKLNEIGIPVVYIGDFLERLPLGRTEWIKFFGCFYDKLDYATGFFDSVENNYNTLLNTTSENPERPKVLVGLPWKGTWWIPGGNSFFANFIRDAGGDYGLNNNTYAESTPHTIEEIFSMSTDIEVWLNPNSVTDRQEIIQTDERLKNFTPLSNARIFNNNKRLNANGGNDFWESGILSPDIILNDLKMIFGNEKDIENKLIYYREVK